MRTGKIRITFQIDQEEGLVLVHEMDYREMSANSSCFRAMYLRTWAKKS